MTKHFASLAAAAVIVLIGMFLLRRDVQVVHFDDVHRAVTQPPNWMPTSPITKAELETPKRLLAQAIINQQIHIGDGFEIQNGSQVAVIHVAFSCLVDNKEQVFDWPSVTAERITIPPGTKFLPGAIVWRMETVEQYTENHVADVAILHPEETNDLLIRHKVTSCAVFEASSK